MILANRILRSISSEMKALMWKTVLASLNPSPVFEAVAVLAEGLAINSSESIQLELDGADDSAVPKRETKE